MAKKETKLRKFTAEMAAKAMIVTGLINQGTAQAYVEQFENEIAKNPNLTVAFRTCFGGSLFDGIPFYNAVRRAIAEGKKPSCIADGLAASTAGLMFLAFDERAIDTMSQWHTHRPTNQLRGNADDFLAQGESLKGQEGAVMAIVCERTGKTPEWVKENWFNGPDHYYGAEYCLANGIANQLVQSDSMAKVTVAIEDNDTPEMVAERLLTQMQLSTDTNIDVKYTTEFKLSIGCKADADDATVEARINALKKAETDLATMVADKATADKEEITKLAKQGIADGKYNADALPGMIALGEKLGKTDFESHLAIMQAAPSMVAVVKEGEQSAASKDAQEKAKLVGMSAADIDAGNHWSALKAADLPTFKAKFKEHYKVEYEG